MAFTDTIARLAVSLSMDTAAFQTGARKAQQTSTGLQSHMTKVGKAITGAFAGIALGEAVQQFRKMSIEAINTVGGLGEVAMQLGVTTDALQEFRYIAGQTGIEQNEIDKALQRLTRTLGDIQAGAKGPTEALKQLGISAADLKGKTADQALLIFADAFNKLPDAATRSSVGFDLMGKSFQTLLPLLAEGSKNIQQMIKDAHEAGIVLTEEEIKKADKAADAMDGIQKKSDARIQSMLAKNADTIVELNTKWAEGKIALTEYAIDLIKGAEANDKMFARWRAGLKGFLDETVSTARAAPAHVIRMVGEIAAAITGRLAAIWEDAKAKVRQVRDAFFDLWDKVTRRSYVPDMVDDIAREMGRLDGVMVEPARRAASAVKASMREMAQETRSLLDRLFPEVARLLGYRADLKTLAGAKLDPGTDAAARGRLAREVTGTAGEVPVSALNDNDPLVDARAMQEAAERTIDAILGLQDKSKIATVAVAKSFADMAQQTLSSLQTLTNAVRGGGFLDILSAVVGLGLQLGGIGAFGKTLANRINAPSTVPRRALGGPVRAGMPYLVGERGPELVVPRHNGTVIPNGKFGGERLQVEVIANNNGFGAIVRNHAGQVVAEAAPALMSGSARVAHSQAAYRQTRRVT